MQQRIAAVIHSLRPRQWIKNLGIFAPLFFNGYILNSAALSRTAMATLAFCFAASAGYIFNDVVDASYDRTHPFKRQRAIARGMISPASAILLSLALALTGLTVAYWVNWSVFAAALLFMVLRYGNTLILRRIAIIDILTIAIGYVIRVYAGIAASGFYISIWLSLTVMSLSLLMAIGKQRAEMTYLSLKKRKIGSVKIEHGRYSEQMVNTYTAMFATSTIITYSYYTFLAGSSAPGFVPYMELFLNRKWMMATIPLVIYGVMRYLQLIYESGEGTLEKILTSDKPMIVTLVSWVLVSFFVIYGIGG